MSDRREIVEYDADDGRYRAQYDPETTDPSVAVVDLVRTITARDSPDPETLYEAVDPEALDRLLEPSPERDRHGPRSVTFSFQGLRITATSDGRLTVRPSGEADR